MCMCLCVCVYVCAYMYACRECRSVRCWGPDDRCPIAVDEPVRCLEGGELGLVDLNVRARKGQDIFRRGTEIHFRRDRRPLVLRLHGYHRGYHNQLSALACAKWALQTNHTVTKLRIDVRAT